MRTYACRRSGLLRAPVLRRKFRIWCQQLASARRSGMRSGQKSRVDLAHCSVGAVRTGLVDAHLADKAIDLMLGAQIAV